MLLFFTLRLTLMPHSLLFPIKKPIWQDIDVNLMKIYSIQCQKQSQYAS